MNETSTIRAYDNLSYDQVELATVMRQTYDELIEFVTRPEFRKIVNEMNSLPTTERPQYVLDVLLNKEELRKRGIVAPEGVLIQRSAFGDRRPTLFVVKKFLPEKYKNVWQNVNITFDNLHSANIVPRDASSCWRIPLDPDSQAAAMAEGLDLQTIL